MFKIKSFTMQEEEPEVPETPEETPEEKVPAEETPAE